MCVCVVFVLYACPRACTRKYCPDSSPFGTSMSIDSGGATGGGGATARATAAAAAAAPAPMGGGAAALTALTAATFDAAAPATALAMAPAEPASEVSSEPRRPWPSRDRRTDRRARGEAHGGTHERAHWACARPSSSVFNLTSTTHTPVHRVLSRARARLCLAGRGIGPILVRVF